MEVKVIKDSKLGLYFDLHSEPTICVPLQNKGLFLDFDY